MGRVCDPKVVSKVRGDKRSMPTKIPTTVAIVVTILDGALLGKKPKWDFPCHDCSRCGRTPLFWLFHLGLYSMTFLITHLGCSSWTTKKIRTLWSVLSIANFLVCVHFFLSYPVLSVPFLFLFSFLGVMHDELNHSFLLIPKVRLREKRWENPIPLVPIRTIVVGTEQLISGLSFIQRFCSPKQGIINSITVTSFFCRLQFSMKLQT